MYNSEQNARTGGAGAPPPRGLLDAALLTIGCALQAQRREASPDLEALRPGIRRLCLEAHRRGVLAEQLIIVMKQAWATFPMGRDPRRDAHRDELRRRVIAMCIDEYYTTRCSAPHGG
jgi:hypothetical protein